VRDLSDFLVDVAARRIRIEVVGPLAPANQRLMDYLGVEVVVSAVVAEMTRCVHAPRCGWTFVGPSERAGVLLTAHLNLMHGGHGNGHVETPEAKREVETVATAPKWTNDSCIHAIKVWAAEHGRPPTNRDFTKAAPGRPTTDQVKRACGSWAAAIAAAGFPAPTRGGAHGRSRSSVREPKASEAAVLSGPPPASLTPAEANGGVAVDGPSPSPSSVREAGSRTDEWLSTLGTSRERLQDEIARLDELSVVSGLQRDALQSFLDELEGV